MLVVLASLRCSSVKILFIFGHRLDLRLLAKTFELFAFDGTDLPTQLSFLLLELLNLVSEALVETLSFGTALVQSFSMFSLRLNLTLNVRFLGSLCLKL